MLWQCVTIFAFAGPRGRVRTLEKTIHPKSPPPPLPPPPPNKKRTFPCLVEGSCRDLTAFHAITILFPFEGYSPAFCQNSIHFDSQCLTEWETYFQSHRWFRSLWARFLATTQTRHVGSKSSHCAGLLPNMGRFGLIRILPLTTMSKLVCWSEHISFHFLPWMRPLMGSSGIFTTMRSTVGQLQRKTWLMVLHLFLRGTKPFTMFSA